MADFGVRKANLTRTAKCDFIGHYKSHVGQRNVSEDEFLLVPSNFYAIFCRHRFEVYQLCTSCRAAIVIGRLIAVDQL